MSDKNSLYLDKISSKLENLDSSDLESELLHLETRIKVQEFEKSKNFIKDQLTNEDLLTVVATEPPSSLVDTSAETHAETSAETPRDPRTRDIREPSTKDITKPRTRDITDSKEINYLIENQKLTFRLHELEQKISQQNQEMKRLNFDKQEIAIELKSIKESTTKTIQMLEKKTSDLTFKLIESERFIIPSIPIQNIQPSALKDKFLLMEFVELQNSKEEIKKLNQVEKDKTIEIKSLKITVDALKAELAQQSKITVDAELAQQSKITVDAELAQQSKITVDAELAQQSKTFKLDHETKSHTVDENLREIESYKTLLKDLLVQNQELEIRSSDAEVQITLQAHEYFESKKKMQEKIEDLTADLNLNVKNVEFDIVENEKQVTEILDELQIFHLDQESSLKDKISWLEEQYNEQVINSEQREQEIVDILKDIEIYHSNEINELEKKYKNRIMMAEQDVKTIQMELLKSKKTQVLVEMNQKLEKRPKVSDLLIRMEFRELENLNKEREELRQAVEQKDARLKQLKEKSIASTKKLDTQQDQLRSLTLFNQTILSELEKLKSKRWYDSIESKVLGMEFRDKEVTLEKLVDLQRVSAQKEQSLHNMTEEIIKLKDEREKMKIIQIEFQTDMKRHADLLSTSKEDHTQCLNVLLN